MCVCASFEFTSCGEIEREKRREKYIRWKKGLEAHIYENHVNEIAFDEN